MSIRIAINGFGRIGRLILRSVIENRHKDIQVVAINDLGSIETNAHLLKYDSIHGTFNKEVRIEYSENSLMIDGHKVQVSSERDPSKLLWKKMNVDIVFECTGLFLDKNSSSNHLKAGAKRVLISAPAKENTIKTVVYSVNSDSLTKNDIIVSNASCTTNCLAPIADILNNSIGIEKGFMTTIHSFTGDQNTVDSLHKDLRRARAASLSMIPTSTGAAKAVGLVLPSLRGKLDGTAVRVPTSNVSMIDLTFLSRRKTSVSEINNMMIHASKNRFKQVLDICTIPLVSSDFNHNPHSSIFDTTQTQIMDENFIRILAWYDNEWGFSNRMLDTANVMGRLLHSN